MAVTYIAPAATHIFGVFYAKNAVVDVSAWDDRAITEALDRGWITPQAGIAAETDPISEADLVTHKASADHDTHNDGRYDATGAAATVNTSLTTHKASADHDAHNDGRYGKIIEGVNTVGASGATQTLPAVTTATMHKVTLTANCAITLPAPAAGESFTIELVQDATGGRAVTWLTPSGAIRWPHGTPPVITGTANAIDIITFLCVGGTNWYGFVAGQAMA